MQINISHTKNTLIGWDVDVKVQAGSGEQIAAVDIRINEMPEQPEALEDGLTAWETELKQKGVYPGSNRVVVTATDQDGNATRSEQRWS